MSMNVAGRKAMLEVAEGEIHGKGTKDTEIRNFGLLSLAASWAP
jgi:hypothetical protein